MARPRQSRARVALERAVAKLATHRGVSGETIGYAGTPDPHHDDFERMVALATPDDLVELLEHHSPVVRAYVAGYVARTIPSLAYRLGPALKDHATVNASSGCSFWVTTVRETALNALCDVLTVEPELAHDAARVLLEQAHHPDPAQREVALACFKQAAAND